MFQNCYWLYYWRLWTVQCNLLSMLQLRLNDQLRSILRNISPKDRIYDKAESSTVSGAIRPLSSASGILCTNNLIVASIGRSWCKSLQHRLKSPTLHGSIVQADQYSLKAVGRDNQVRVKSHALVTPSISILQPVFFLALTYRLI